MHTLTRRYHPGRNSHVVSIHEEHIDADRALAAAPKSRHYFYTMEELAARPGFDLKAGDRIIDGEQWIQIDEIAYHLGGYGSSRTVEILGTINGHAEQYLELHADIAVICAA